MSEPIQNMAAPISAKAFGQSIQNINSSSFKDDIERRSALAMARSLCRRIEQPMESMLRIAWMEPTGVTCLKIALDIKLFEAMGNDPGRSSTIEQLSKATNCDPTLLKRLLRLLAAMQVVVEIDENTYAPTELSIALQDHTVNSAINFRFLLHTAFDTLPAFLKKTGYQNPTDGAHGPWQYATGKDITFFDWLLQNPEALQTMSSHMSGYTQGRETWESIYPIQERTLKSCENTEDILLVDVGGSVGHDLRRFSSNTGLDNEKPGRLILQDLAAVVSQCGDLPPSIKAIPIDFFQEPPVPGARSYYLHSILHDWPDQEALKILQTMRPALRQREDGYKPKLLLNENVIALTGVREQTASQDLIMALLCASHERTEEQWRDLLEEAGYYVTGIFSKPYVDEAIIEAELIES